MKKLFTFVFGVLFALCANAAVYDIGEPGNNVKDGDNLWYNSETKTINFFGQWSYRPGWWLGTLDCSDYDEFVLEIDNKDNLKIQVFLEYNDKYENEGKEVTYNSTAQGNTDKIVLPLNSEHKHSIMQIFLQYTSADASVDAPKSVTFKKAYFQNAAPAPASTAIWEGSNDFGNDWEWDKTVGISADKFATLETGDQLKFTYSENDDKTYWQFKLADQAQTSSVLTSNKADLNDWDCATMASGSTEYVVTLNESDVALLKATGLRVSGFALTLSKVEILHPTTQISNTIIDPVVTSAKTFNLAGQQVGKSYKGIVIKNGKKYVQK